MPQIFPLKNYGNRMINVSLRSGETYWIRTYYSEGQIDAWFFDMWDAQMTELIKGVPVVTGSANLIGAHPDKFPAGAKLVAVLTDGEQDGPDALGNGLDLVWYDPGEESPYVIGDPMLSAESTDFQIPGQEATGDHSVLNNRFIPGQHNIPAIQGLAESLAEKATIEQLNQKLSDAPSDGISYSRRNGEWVPDNGGAGWGSNGVNHFDIEGTSLILMREPGSIYPDELFFYEDGDSLVMRQVAM